jgi:hypothetical protein
MNSSDKDFKNNVVVVAGGGAGIENAVSCFCKTRSAHYHYPTQIFIIA